MTDNLRDRIADVLADEFKRQGYACEWAVLADAVIEALTAASPSPTPMPDATATSATNAASETGSPATTSTTAQPRAGAWT